MKVCFDREIIRSWTIADRIAWRAITTGSLLLYRRRCTNANKRFYCCPPRSVQQVFPNFGFDILGFQFYSWAVVDGSAVRKSKKALIFFMARCYNFFIKPKIRIFLLFLCLSTQCLQWSKFKYTYKIGTIVKLLHLLAGRWTSSNIYIVPTPGELIIMKRVLSFLYLRIK